ncbi:MAG: PAS domain S-box protein [Patescibacteria group bacterium]|nr:PAS domain S-box protein [Patescibacteria group bacterium]
MKIRFKIFLTFLIINFIPVVFIVATIFTNIKFYLSQSILSKLTDIVLFVGAVEFLAVGVVILAVSKSISDPIEKLGEGLKVIAAGDLDKKVGTSDKDETGELSRMVDLMIIQLKESHFKYKELALSLEEKVKERTSDLEKFKMAIEGASDSVIITDQDGYIIYVNKAAETFSGYLKEEIIGKRPSLWGNQMPKEFYQEMWETIKDKKQPFGAELTNKRKDGESYEVELHISPVIDENGDVKYFVGVEMDITKQKQIDRSKNEFISIASHQLRTPLSSIKWTIEMLEEDKSLTDIQKGRLNDLYKSNQRLINLVNDLLNVSHIETGKMIIHPDVSNVVSVVGASIKSISPDADKKNQKITLSVEGEIKDSVFDSTLFAAAFNNILSNAISYGFPESNINVSLKNENNFYITSVHDNGLVISAEDKEKIFTKFNRSPEAQKIRPEGSGLGLFIVKSLIELQGGYVKYDSSKERGTTFYLAMPIK